MSRQNCRLKVLRHNALVFSQHSTYAGMKRTIPIRDYPLTVAPISHGAAVFTKPESAVISPVPVPEPNHWPAE